MSFNICKEMLIISKLLKLLIEHQEGNKESTQELIMQFMPLLKKYAKLLKYEDAENDLLVDFLKVLNKAPTTKEHYMLGYIAKAMKNIYIQLSKKQKKQANTMYSDEISNSENISDPDANFNRYALKNALAQLTDVQRAIIIHIFFYGYRINEISKILNISRQTVSKQKKKALSALRKMLA